MSLPQTTATAQRRPAPAAGSLTTHPLKGTHEPEALAFLAAPTLQNVILSSSFIRDNGLESPFNRGTFYACRDAEGRLEGIGLIGDIILVEARSDAAFAAFARLAQGYTRADVIMGERENLERFWGYYAEGGQAPRRFCRELLFEQRRPADMCEAVPGLRLATPADLDQVTCAHAQMALLESGVNPLEVDPDGFRQRCARRIDQQRVWVLTEGGRLIFKADVIAETPHITYLEGIYVTPEERSKGFGSRCLSQIGRTLLKRTKSICLLVNEQNQKAPAFYRKAGYELRGSYDTIFLR